MKRLANQAETRHVILQYLETVEIGQDNPIRFHRSARMPQAVGGCTAELTTPFPSDWSRHSADSSR